MFSFFGKKESTASVDSNSRAQIELGNEQEPLTGGGPTSPSSLPDTKVTTPSGGKIQYGSILTRQVSSDIHSFNDTASFSTSGGDDDASVMILAGFRIPSLRRIALILSLYVNIAITVGKLVAYIQTLSLSVLAALLDSLLDVVSQLVLNYTEKQANHAQQRSSAVYPAGAARLEPIGVLTCAALMGMASFEVLKESITALLSSKSAMLNHRNDEVEVSCGPEMDSAAEVMDDDVADLTSFWFMLVIILTKLFLLWLCNRGANKRLVMPSRQSSGIETTTKTEQFASQKEGPVEDDGADTESGEQKPHHHPHPHPHPHAQHPRSSTAKAVVQLADPTIEALAQDHFNDVLSNSVAAVALLFALRSPNLWFLDPVGAIVISIYIIYSWYLTGMEQIEQLTGKSAPEDFITDIHDLASSFDDRLEVDVVRAYHFGPKFLVEIEVVMPKETLLFESHDVGMDLQYEIEALEDVERCFVHIDYQQRPYDEHVVSKVPELREKYRPKRQRSVSSL